MLFLKNDTLNFQKAFWVPVERQPLEREHCTALSPIKDSFKMSLRVLCECLRAAVLLTSLPPPLSGKPTPHIRQNRHAAISFHDIGSQAV